jgi:hypothetical protein
MPKLFFHTLLLLASVVSEASVCRLEIVERWRDPGAIEHLAVMAKMGVTELQFFLSDPELSDRIQALLITQHLLNHKADDLIAELYQRSQATTKYSKDATHFLRFKDWIGNFKFWTPFYREREMMFADSLRAIGESLPPTILSQFNGACARVQEPGFLRTLQNVSGPLTDAIHRVAISQFDVLRKEVVAYADALNHAQSPRRLVGKTDFPARSPKADFLEKAITQEIFSFVGSLDFIPGDLNEMEKKLDDYLKNSLSEFPGMAEQVKKLMREFHLSNSPLSYAEFKGWAERRFIRIIDLERKKLLKLWKETIPVAQPSALSPTRATEIETEDLADTDESDEIDIETLALFADSEPITKIARSKKITNRPKRIQNPRNRRERNLDSVETSVAANPDKFFVVLTPKARRNFSELSRSETLEAQLKKTLEFLSINPERHPSLETHAMRGTGPERLNKVFRSYVNVTGKGYRVHWRYVVDPQTIEVIEFVRHDG